MTLERKQGGDPGEVRLVECPFCGADLGSRTDTARGNQPARHLEQCEAFEATHRDHDRADQEGGR